MGPTCHAGVSAARQKPGRRLGSSQITDTALARPDRPCLRVNLFARVVRSVGQGGQGPRKDHPCLRSPPASDEQGIDLVELPIDLGQGGRVWTAAHPPEPQSALPAFGSGPGRRESEAEISVDLSSQNSDEGLDCRAIRWIVRQDSQPDDARGSREELHPLAIDDLRPALHDEARRKKQSDMVIKRRGSRSELIGQLFHGQGSERQKAVHDILSPRCQTQ